MKPSSSTQHADVISESDAHSVQRVVAWPLDIGPVTALPPGEKHSGFDAKQLRLQHFYTGDVLRVDSTSAETIGNSGFIPHGTGTMACVLYVKSGAHASPPQKSIPLPYAALVEHYSEVSDLRNTLLLSLAVYSGAFARGQRHGRGKLTVCRKYAITCDWDSDAPLLDGASCLLQLLNSAPAESSPRPAGQYAGMVALLSSGIASQRCGLAGLAWAHQAQFVADGVGEMHTLCGVQRCGSWQCGQRHGFGVEFDPAAGTVYIGKFAYDHRDGPGALHYCATGALLCGNWKDGKLTATGNLVFPSWPFALQGTLWKNYETYSFEYGTLVRSGGSLSGVWEPLFVDFDEFLATSVADLQQQKQQQKQPKKQKQHVRHAVAQDNTEHTAEADAMNGPRTQDRTEAAAAAAAAADEDDGAKETSGFLSLFSTMMQRPDFTAALATFQRCYYFLYKPCLGTASKPSQGPSPLAPVAGGVPCVLQALAALGRRATALPAETGGWTSPSWCEEVCRANASPLCPHDKTLSVSFATRMPPEKLFERAMHDLASFVSSVRLRLLSYVAAHPAACGVSVSKRLIAVCWDAVFALVAPVVHELAAAADAAAAAETLLALSRCAELRAEDFVPVDAARAKRHRVCRFMPSPQYGGSSSGSGNSGEREEKEEKGEKEEKEMAWRFAAPSRHARRGIAMTSSGPLLLFGEQSGAAYPSLADMFSLFSAAWREARGLFPARPLRQERWMCVRLLDAFSDRSEGAVGGASAVLNPVAVLRVLRVLTCSVNPLYPLTCGENKETDIFQWGMGGHAPRTDEASDTGGKEAHGNEEDDDDDDDDEYKCDGEKEEEYDNNNNNNDTEERFVTSVLNAADAALERLRHTYPSIRRCERGAARVYPLDELAVRTRFTLLAASGSISKETMSVRRALHRAVPVMEEALREQCGDCAGDEDMVHTPARNVSEIVLWAAECIGGVLDPSNGTTHKNDESLWSLFLPYMASARCEDKDRIITTTKAETKAEAETEAEAGTRAGAEEGSGHEAVQLSLLRQFLADVGIRAELRVRFCYDNEEDALMGRVPARCVGREATLSLSVPDGFVGGLVCESLAEAWLQALLIMRVMSTRRRTTRTDLSQRNSAN